MESNIKVPVKSSSAEVKPYAIDTFQRSIHLFNPLSVEARADALALVRRLDNLLILVAAPSSEEVRGIPEEIYTLEIFRRLHRSFPANAANIYIWQAAAGSGEPLIYTSGADSDLSRLDNDLPGIGVVNLAEAIDRVTEFGAELRGTTGILLLTRWDSISNSEYEAILRFRQMGESSTGFTVQPDVKQWESLGGGRCVFAIGVGNKLSRTLFDDADYCGFSMAADKVAQPRDMAHFVEQMLFIGPRDTDGDGIYDYRDDCPTTQPRQIVNYRGCRRFAEQGAK